MPINLNFCKTEVEYLGYLITREGIKLQAKKVQALHNMVTPKVRKRLQNFLGLLNYHRRYEFEKISCNSTCNKINT